MPLFKVDDALHSHPKAIKAGDEAIGLWTRAGAFSMAYGTDGFVPEWWVKQQPRGMVKAKRLVDALMWHPANRDEPGWEFHQWRQDSKEQIEADREKARQRKQRSRRDVTPDVTRDMGVTSGVTSGGSHGEPPGIPNTHTLPVETLGGKLTQPSAGDSPPPICRDHPENPEKPCWRCKNRREWEQTHAEQAAKTAAIERRKIVQECPDCDDFGWLLDVEPATKCGHKPAQKVGAM